MNQGDYYNNSYGAYGDQQQQQQYNSYNEGNNTTTLQQQQQQQQYYQEDPQQQYQQPEYYPDGSNTNTNNDGYYEQDHQYDHDLNNQYNGEYTETNYDDGQEQQEQHQQQYTATADPNSPFYPTNTPFVIHPNGTPDNYGNYDTMGDAISAIAIDDNDNNGDANNRLMYVASHTSNNQGEEGRNNSIAHGNNRVHPTMGGGGRSSSSRRVGGGGGMDKEHPGLSRGSRLTVLYNDEHSSHGDTTASNSSGVGGFYGNKSIYSSFMGHPEAEGRVLDGLHSVLFGGGMGIVSSNSSTTSNNISTYGGIKARPTHAYGPPFSPPTYTHNNNNTSHRNNNNTNNSSRYSLHHHHHHNTTSNPNHTNRPEDRHCMGISNIFPVTTPYLGSGGRVCTISPQGIRIHTRGGMIMSEKQELLSGMTCGENVLGGSQFATVGGMSSFPTTTGSSPSSSSTRVPQHVHCVDLHRDLKIVSSHTLVRNSSRGGSSGSGGEDKLLCVTDMATNHERNNIVVGCSDGTIRVLDGGRRNAEVAKAKAQVGGVAKVAVSENLICASGYSYTGVSSPSSPLPYPFPAPHVLIYDVRYLGRGGIPHTFHANRGGPRFLEFLPDGNVLVGSGQTFGGFEVMTPFDETPNDDNGSKTFFQPELTAGESMTTVNYNEGELYIGTSYGRVLQYGMTNYETTMHSTAVTTARGESASGSMLGAGSALKKSMSGQSFGRATSGGSTGAVSSTIPPKESLDMPPFVPTPPKLSIDPAILCSSHQPPSSSFGESSVVQGWNVFDAYVLASNPILSMEKGLFHPRYSRARFSVTSMGPLSTKALVAPSKRWLSKELQTKLDESAASAANDGRGSVGGQNSNNHPGADFVKVFPTSSLGLGDLLTPAVEETRDVSSRYKGKKANAKMTTKAYPNPNKFIFSTESFAACYDATADPRRNTQDGSSSSRHGELLGEEDLIQGEENGIPRRYRLMVRPPFYKVSNFDYTLYNDTGLFVGWDYAPSFANSFACSVLSLLYFTGEIRETALKLQLCSNELSTQVGKSVRREMSVSVTAELGLLFHLIESLSSNGMVQPDTGQGNRGQVKAFVPSNFISAFALLPEATNLALIDGVAGSAEIARRPEAFYRFLMQFMERELGQLSSASASSILPEILPETNSNVNQGHLIDRMQGIGFLSIIEYARGKPKISISRALTVDLAYEQRWCSTKNSVRFGEILRYSLCKEAPLRAWCEETRSYEAVIQRKIATSLPSLLSLSCCCAGRTANTHGLQFWQQEDSCKWLPEFIEIQIETDKSITVKELLVNEDGGEEWMTFEQKLPLADSFFVDWEKDLPQNLPIKKSYRLDAVVSFIRANSDSTADSSHLCEGHHVVHVRKPIDLEINALATQLRQIERCLAENEQDSLNADHTEQLTLVSGISMQERKQHLEGQLRKLKEKETEWLLLNGFIVTTVDNADVRSFNATFKEPSIVLFREIADSNNGGKEAVKVEPSEDLSNTIQRDSMVPVSVMGTASISNGHGPKLTISDLLNLPSKRDLVAIDAEFVCVQPEESLITYSGSKEVISEPRNALARLSIINCQANEVIIDDYVLPQEPVVDYLTRFSGIQPNDLDATSSPHHLVTPQEAYLKVRLLMERGCIFVGHGLSQDFRVINICIPPNQIIDTAEIYHQPNQRYISLRYLTNHVLGRDMQQEVHDSIEDAKAAHELYIKALSLKKEGKFDDYLMELYAHGHKTQFKLGVVNVK